MLQSGGVDIFVTEVIVQLYYCVSADNFFLMALKAADLTFSCFFHLPPVCCLFCCVFQVSGINCCVWGVETAVCEIGVGIL